MCNHKVSDIWSTIIVKWMLENKIFFCQVMYCTVKYGICSSFTGKCNKCCPGRWDICTLFKPHCGVFVWATWPHHGAFAAAPEKNDMYALQMPGGRGGWVCLELTEPLMGVSRWIEFCKKLWHEEFTSFWKKKTFRGSWQLLPKRQLQYHY